MIELFTSAFVTLLVIIDPPGCAPIFASLTRGGDAGHRRKMAVRSTAVAWCILIFFAFLGQPMLRTLGISLASFRIAGGIMLFLIALEMVFEKRTQRREARAQDVIDRPEIEDVSVFPMAMPMIAGPGSIASVMLLMGQSESWAERGVVLGALGVVLVVTLIALLAAGPLMRLVGERIEIVITRVLGVILAALAAQFVIDGLRASFT